MTKPSLLILDDEKEVLNALNRVLRKDFELFLFSEPEQALDFYRDKPLPLIISDMRMPSMDGATFLSHICDINPYSKRFLLTGHADVNATVSAVNEGKITHYFAKPWSNEELVNELKEAYSTYLSERKKTSLLKSNLEKNAKLSLINSSLELEINKNKQKLELVSSREAKSFVRLKKTFSTFFDIYASTIALHTQDLTGHSFRVANHARLLAENLGCDNLTAYQIYIAGLLYETGKIALPQSLLSKPLGLLTRIERDEYDVFYQKSSEMLSPVAELHYVADIIRHIPEHYNGRGNPEHLAGEEIPLGSRIISAISAFDDFIIGRQTQIRLPIAEAKNRVKSQSSYIFDPEVLKKYFDILQSKPKASEGEIEYPADLTDLIVGSVTTHDIKNTNDNILLTKGMVIEQQHIDKLAKLQLNNEIVSPFFIKAVD